MSGSFHQGAGSSTCSCVQAQKLEAKNSSADCCALIVAAGQGRRFGDERGKQFIDLRGLPLCCWSLLAFDRAPSIGHLVIVYPQGRKKDLCDSVLSRIQLRCQVTFVEGGPTRQDSVMAGLTAMPHKFEMVAIHDAVRPLVSVDTIERCVAALRHDSSLAGAISATPSTDTLKLVEDTTVIATPDRSFYWCAQTPQVFRTRKILAAHRAARFDAFQGTDDASLVERRGERVICITGSRDNIKVTVPEDLVIAEALLERRLMREGCGLCDLPFSADEQSENNNDSDNPEARSD